jgi:hypothetical protein
MIRISDYEYSCDWNEIKFALNNLERIKQDQCYHEQDIDMVIDFVKKVAYKIDTIQHEYRDFIKSLTKDK